MEQEARNLWRAMQAVFSAGFTTPDLARRGDDEKKISTAEFGDKVVEELSRLPPS
jgi:3-isopropylmalate dehydrogenase